METVTPAEYTGKEQQIAVYAKALAHPARIAILEVLLRKKTCICGSIVDELPLAQSTVSQHLKELKNAGLIQGTIEGTSTCYCINDKEWTKAASLLQNFFNRLPSKKTGNCK